MEKTNMDQHTIRNDKGEIDIAASTNAYAKALSLWVSENEKIEKAVFSVMEKYAGKKLLKQMLINLAVQEVNPDPDQYTNLSKRAQEFIDAQKKAGTIIIGRGKKPGIRFADANEPAEETAEELPSEKTISEETEQAVNG
jgi:uncharacterized membrane protein YgaE (UPF0421/DUF939 family)